MEKEYVSEFKTAKETFERFAVSETESIYLKKIKVLERIGRLKQKYAVIARYYNINLHYDESGKRVHDLTWKKKAGRDERAVLTGCYVIETTHLY